MGLFPFEVELADGTPLQIREAPGAEAYSLIVAGADPLPITDPDDLTKLSLVLELAASRRKESLDLHHEEQADRDRAST